MSQHVSRRCGQMVAATVVVAIAAGSAVFAAQSVRKHFLWVVTRGEGPPTYLLGSLHVAPAGFYPLPARIEEAFAASQVLIEEVDLNEATNPATALGLMQRAMLPAGKSLSMVISADLHKEVMTRADKSGLPRAALERIEPWLVALTLAQPALSSAGFKAEHGIDKHFFDRAVKHGIKRRALETVAFQVDRLDQLSAAQQEAMLRSTLEEVDSQIENVKTIAVAWSRGDTGALESLLLPTLRESPELYQRLLVDRNAAWVPAVDECVTQRTACFIVVGAAHLVGPDSLVAMLRKKGYKVEQQ